MKLIDILTESTTGMQNLRQQAAAMSLVDFLDANVGELLNTHLDHGKTPARVVHDHLDPTTLDPSEWDDWDDRFMADSKDKIASMAAAYTQRGKIPPVLVRGSINGQYMPQVIDGHHRTAAAIDTKSKVPVVYNIDTLVELWKSVNYNQTSVRDLITLYHQHLSK